MHVMQAMHDFQIEAGQPGEAGIQNQVPDYTQKATRSEWA